MPCFIRTNHPTQLQWKTLERAMTREELPVLTYQLSYPQLTQPNLAGQWINLCYRHTAQVWQRRWEQVVYPRACTQHTERLSRSAPFTPWQCQLTGQVTNQEGDLLTLRFIAMEQQGTRPPYRLIWEDCWDLRTGISLSKKAPKNGLKKFSDFFKKGVDFFFQSVIITPVLSERATEKTKNSGIV